jgi:hypothetical protein
MREITKEDLKEIIFKHQKWLNGDPSGGLVK